MVSDGSYWYQDVGRRRTTTDPYSDPDESSPRWKCESNVVVPYPAWPFVPASSNGSNDDDRYVGGVTRHWEWQSYVALLPHVDVRRRGHSKVVLPDEASHFGAVPTAPVVGPGPSWPHPSTTRSGSVSYHPHPTIAIDRTALLVPDDVVVRQSHPVRPVRTGTCHWYGSIGWQSRAPRPDCAGGAFVGRWDPPGGDHHAWRRRWEWSPPDEVVERSSWVP